MKQPQKIADIAREITQGLRMGDPVRAARILATAETYLPPILTGFPPCKEPTAFERIGKVMSDLGKGMLYLSVAMKNITLAHGGAGLESVSKAMTSYERRDLCPLHHSRRCSRPGGRTMSVIVHWG